MSVLANGFLTDTLIWTGVLIALVLVIRRPAAHLFGARAAYALWALPMARLLLPPIVLPAWLAPRPDAPPTSDATTAAALMAMDNAGTVGEPVALAVMDWPAILFALWLAGAGVFLVRRYALYFQMRRELLAKARPVGEAGRVRLVETPAADGPVAFGVLDKVIALPSGFMAAQDRGARDLALAHELAHHRGRDLLCNMLVQPLFALHWFNPLAALGWRALRRDQEAACDARVMARQPRERRAAYAAVIAAFATQPKCPSRLALAAPMVCPVLGDRSIVQRLRSLAMSDISRGRRWLGRLLLGAGALALPLTGSISYAQDEVLPTPPVAPISPAAPVATVIPAAPVTTPAPPTPPERIVTPDGETRIIRLQRRIDDRRRDDERTRHDGGKRIEKHIIFRSGHDMTAEERAEFEKDMAEHRQDMAEFNQDMAGLQRELAENQHELDREVRVAIAEAHRSRPQVRVHCRDGQRDVAETVTDRSGETIFVCQAIAMADARKAMAMARSEIVRSRDLSRQQRDFALRSLDEAERQTRDQIRAD